MKTETVLVTVLLGLQVPVMAGLGVLFLRGKGAGLVIHTQREWHTTDVPRLLRFLAKLMFALAACWALMTLGNLLGRLWLFWLGLALFVAVAVGGAVFANTKRFKTY